MSTQTTFDLDGLRRAVRARDAKYQLALYADNAQVEIVDADHPSAPLQVLRGKSAIREWLGWMSSQAVGYEVTDAVAGPGAVQFTEECHYPDGTDLRYRCRAEVHRGQITRACVTVGHPQQRERAAMAGGVRHTGGTVLRDLPTRPASTEAGPVNRRLPGNFLG